MNLKPGPKPKPKLVVDSPPAEHIGWPRAVHLLDGRRLEVTGAYSEMIGPSGLLAALTFSAGAQFGRVAVLATAISFIELGQTGEVVLRD